MKRVEGRTMGVAARGCAPRARERDGAAIRVTAEAEDEALGAGTAEGLVTLVRACAAPQPVQPAAALDAALA